MTPSANVNTAGSIQTHSGVFFDPFNPDPSMICIEDIAHALSNQCRYSGHIKRFYSVAEHSILVANLCSPENQLWALLHDASEAYLVDLPRPIKRHPEMLCYRETEAKVMRAVCSKFGLNETMPDEVHKCDNEALVAEARVLLHGVDHWISWPELHGIDTKWSEVFIEWSAWGPETAKKVFLELFDSLERP